MMRLAGEYEGHFQRGVYALFKEWCRQSGKIGIVGQRLQREVKPRAGVADVGPQHAVKRIFAIARIMPDQAEIELVIARQEQRGIDRYSDDLPTRVLGK